MFDYDSIKFAYDAGWATPEDLELYAEYGVLTEEQVKEILGVNNELPEVEESTEENEPEVAAEE